jgi:short-subunit dehydrogenase
MALTEFDGSVAVITGGASGIGLATAHALYASGAHVVLADINASALQQAAQQVHESNPTSAAQILVIPTDVTIYSQVETLMREALTPNGRIDLIVTCAGIGRGGPIDMVSSEEMQSLLNVNFMGTYNCVHAVLPTLRQQQSGHFVFLSSVAGKLGVPFLTGYCATKWAIRGFSSALRAELYGSSIGVTTVYPSWVDTPMAHVDAASAQIMNIKILLSPEQVVNAILEAVQHNQHDVTLVPEQDTAQLIQLMQHDPDQAEQITGAAFHKQLTRLMRGQEA